MSTLQIKECPCDNEKIILVVFPKPEKNAHVCGPCFITKTQGAIKAYFVKTLKEIFLN